ncbi:MAG: 4Fe-4S ferredoxin [Methanohalophilus sp.]|jgi:methylamine methyltransferase corrinoid activation protein|nr:MAG: 4Fe-4S ferredoxin [Methanohalophilus sp.]
MYGIALDLGTSGFRLQLIDIENRDIVKTVIATRHPLPGGNVIDHLDFAIRVGEDIANDIMIKTIEYMIRKLPIKSEKINKIVVCGNPIQLSLFQNIEIRDLAYAGKNMQKRLGVEDIERNLNIYYGKDIFVSSPQLYKCEIIVLPSIKHEIGADALAMMIKTDFLKQKKPALVTDYGTNAEMALKIGDRIITGSAAAGPAIEGQGIKCGMLASPGSICDVNQEGDYWRIAVLDQNMLESKGPLINPVTGDILEQGDIQPLGITGTGIVSVVCLALSTGLIKNLPDLPNGKLFLGEAIEVNDKDIKEAGKAIGAIRAAHLTLLIEAGVDYGELEYMYMCGASGTYVNADKARKIGLSPGFVKNIVQFGNTSLALAKDVLLGNIELQDVCKLAHRIKVDHHMMASSETFKEIYTCELAYWTEGMPEKDYDMFMQYYKLPKIPPLEIAPIIEKRATKDIEDSGYGGVEFVGDINIIIEEEAKGCIECHRCERECPEKAIVNTNKNGSIYADYIAHRCLGMSCKRCVDVCPVRAIKYRDIKALAM